MRGSGTTMSATSKMGDRERRHASGDDRAELHDHQRGSPDRH
jgi:hypothetical protein